MVRQQFILDAEIRFQDLELDLGTDVRIFVGFDLTELPQVSLFVLVCGLVDYLTVSGEPDHKCATRHICTALYIATFAFSFFCFCVCVMCIQTF